MMTKSRKHSLFWLLLLIFTTLVVVAVSCTDDTNAMEEDGRKTTTTISTTVDSDSDDTSVHHKRHPMLNSIRYVEPFDEEKWLTIYPDSKFFEMLGSVDVIDTFMSSSPSYFPCSFGFYTRKHNINAIEMKPSTFYTINPEIGQKPKATLYEFNLTQLMPDQLPFDPFKRTIFIIPGYLSGDYMKWQHTIKDHWLELEDVNVIIVHWTKGNQGFYDTAVANSKLVSRQITVLLYYLTQLNDINFDDKEFRSRIYFVGHSCGAHIAGFVGQELNGQVGRITGLDPAGPVFDEQTSLDNRLDPSDAKFVDIIHTNAGHMKYYRVGLGALKKAASYIKDKMRFTKVEDHMDLATLVKQVVNKTSSSSESFHTPWYGMEKQIGHMDYYVNGGSEQPGCNDELHICDHGRAVDIYTRALEYELYARRAYSELEDSDIIERGSHRLIAFPADDYEGFKSGASLIDKCRSLVIPNELISLTETNINNEEFKKCTVPIDFVKPTEDYVKELVEQYEIDLKDEKEQDRRYYFDTLPDDPFVGDYYLLRIHFSQSHHDHINWMRGCKLYSLLHSTSATSMGKIYSQIEYQGRFLVPYQLDNFYGLILPLMNPHDWREAFPTKQKVLTEINQIKESSSVDAYTNFCKLVPEYLTIGLSQNSSEGIFSRSYQTISNLIGSKISTNSKSDDTTDKNKADENNQNCGFSYNALELRSLNKALSRSFSLWYAEDFDENPPIVRNHSNLVDDMKISQSKRLGLAAQSILVPLKAIGLDELQKAAQ